MKEAYCFSSYSIVIPLDSEPENVFMMHGYTGAIDILSKEIAAYLQGHDFLLITMFHVHKQRLRHWRREDISQSGAKKRKQVQ